jgi:1-acyl-sn-glycerol-3-phosphate acyltransferase
LIRAGFVFFLLLGLKAFARTFYRLRSRWVGEMPGRPWADLRIVVVLNHTSLFEVLYAGVPPASFLWRLARHGLLPAANKTTNRPFVGLLFKLIARNVIPISRQRDHTWTQVLQRIDPDSMVVMAPEGRMKRATGLDLQGQPLTVRGGIADILEAIPKGRMLIAYSGGLHHVQVPGERLPRFFRAVGLLIETVDIEAYRAEMSRREGDFKLAVKADLEARRDRYCPQAAELAGVDYI